MLWPPPTVFLYQSWLKVLPWIVGPVFASPLSASKESIVEVTKIVVWYLRDQGSRYELFIDLFNKYLLSIFYAGHVNVINKSENVVQNLYQYELLGTEPPEGLRNRKAGLKVEKLG